MIGIRILVKTFPWQTSQNIFDFDNGLAGLFNSDRVKIFLIKIKNYMSLFTAGIVLLAVGGGIEMTYYPKARS
jgi:hypothetical protein